MNMKKIFIVSSCLIFTLAVATACHQHKAKQQQAYKTIVAKQQSSLTDLFFQTTIKPYHVVSVSSQVDGVISQKFFDYGQLVQKGQKLFAINSQKSQQEYYQALVDYIKARQDYTRSKVNFDGTAALWKHKLVSYENYLSDKDSLKDAKLSLLQAEFKLKQLHSESGGVDYRKIGADDIGSVEKMLMASARTITVRSPMTGIALLSVGNSDDKGSKLQVGSQVKKDQVLLTIGDLEGITLAMTASEIHINHIAVGDRVTITGPAFPDEVLQGQITLVGSQSAPSGYDSGVARFPVKVLVKALTAKQRRLIHVGMTAEVKLELHGKPTISIPINAVVHKDGSSYVRVLDNNTKKIKMVKVITGKTSMTNVEILRGLNEGDRVVVE